jgi:uncharacterized protein (DUF58 family)
MRAYAAQFIDPAELARLANLSLVARTAVLGLQTGLHQSVHTGSSTEFAQYRPYSQGDDPRFVDWRLYGRTDRLHSKEFQDESNMRCMVLLDCSASMDYASGPVSKFRYAQMLAACLVLLLARQRDCAGFIAYHGELGMHMPPRVHPNHARRIIVELEKLRPEGLTDTAGALRFLGDVLPPRGMVVLISDLLHPVDEVINHLRSLRARRHDVIVFQISDPAEQSFAFERVTMLQDAEDLREQFADPAAMRAQYQANREAHYSRIRSECLAAEISIDEFTTNEPLDRALHHFINRRNHALMTASRRRSHASRGGR